MNTTMVFVTTDGGRTWSDLASLRAVSTVSMVSFADPQHGFLMLGGDGGAMGQDPVWLYRTSDGGQTWTPVPQGTNFAQLGVNIDFTDREDGLAWTTGENADPTPPTSIYQTTNSGRTLHAYTPTLAG